jgi:hypothetical protein
VGLGSGGRFEMHEQIIPDAHFAFPMIDCATDEIGPEKRGGGRVGVARMPGEKPLRTITL